MPQGPIATSQIPGATRSSLNVTGAAVLVKAGAGVAARIIVQVAGSAPGTVNDSATVAGAAAANQIATIPNTVGVIVLDWPYASGLVITPGTGQTVAVSYL